MSQVDTVTQADAAGRSKVSRLKERVEGFLRTFEWTWTNTVLFCFALIFFVLVTTSVIPSFWLYFADQKLKWDGSGPNGFWLKELRDAVAMGLVTGPFITVLVVAAILQNWRHKLRGYGDSRPTGGYR